MLCYTVQQWEPPPAVSHILDPSAALITGCLPEPPWPKRPNHLVCAAPGHPAFFCWILITPPHPTPRCWPECEKNRLVGLLLRRGFGGGGNYVVNRRDIWTLFVFRRKVNFLSWSRASPPWLIAPFRGETCWLAGCTVHRHILLVASDPGDGAVKLMAVNVNTVSTWLWWSSRCAWWAIAVIISTVH